MLRIKLNSDRENACVGIWWWDGEKFMGRSCLVVDGYDDGRFVQYSNTENHLSLWPRICEENGISKDIRYRGYKFYERGRVVYNIGACSFDILCSQDLAMDARFRAACVREFSLADCPIAFIANQHYHRVTTDNPEVLKYEYGEF